MQRLSLPSPSSLREHHIDTNNAEELKLRHSLSSASSLAADDDTAGKTRRSSLSPPSRSDTFLIHLLPLLIFLCFFILYLFSHPPSDSDMAHFHTSNRFSHQFRQSQLDSGDLNNTGRVQDDVFPVRAVKNMREKRTHRKFANF